MAGSRSAAGTAQRAGTGAWGAEVVTEVTMFTSRQELALGSFKRAWRSYDRRWRGQGIVRKVPSSVILEPYFF